MTARGSESLTFNAENRLSQWTSGASTATFVYDGDGSRVKKTEGGQTTVYVNRNYEKNVATGEETLYYWLGGRLVAVKKAGTLSYVHQDHLGSASVITDTAGNTASSLGYFPYGNSRSSTGTVPTERKFTGQRLDGTGLYFYNARYYDAGLGRFVSGDTIVPDLANPQALNRYSYVINNPLRYTDPTGQWHRPDDELRVAFIEGPDPALPTENELTLYDAIKREHGWAEKSRAVRSREIASLLTAASSYQEFLTRLSDAAGVSEAEYPAVATPPEPSASSQQTSLEQQIFRALEITGGKGWETLEATSILTGGFATAWVHYEAIPLVCPTMGIAGCIAGAFMFVQGTVILSGSTYAYFTILYNVWLREK